MRNIHFARAAFLLALTCSCMPIVSAQQGAPDPKTAATLKEAASLPTPKMPDGHPNLTGYWGTVVGQFGFEGKTFIDDKSGSSRPLFGETGTEARNAKGYYDGRANYDKNAATRPVYKAEYRDKAKTNFMQSEKLDPSYECQPQGVPRLGAPNEIFQSADAVVLLYENPYDSSNRFVYRVVPTDGRGHDPNADPMPLGDSVGRWEGDTLVVDVTELSPNTWISSNGSFHDTNLHVVEKFSRAGNTLTYAVTMEDPTLFEQPFSPKPTTLILKTGEHSHEDYPCSERDREHVTYEEGK
jgi:hypothetical protein